MTTIIVFGSLHQHFHGTADPSFLNPVIERLDKIMATQEEIVQQLANDAQTAQLLLQGVTKVAGEVTGLHAQIAALQDIINNMPNASPELVTAANGVTAGMQSLKDALKSLDDLTPDEAPKAD